MKTTTPKKISRRDKVVDSMAKKFANAENVEQKIIAIRKRRIKKAPLLYVAIGVTVVSLLLSTLATIGFIEPPAVVNNDVPIKPKKTIIDLLSKDLAERKLTPDQYAVYLIDYLIHYSSLPEVYRSEDLSTVPNRVTYKALYDIWPKVNLRTRANLLEEMPLLEKKWRELGLAANEKVY
jgi:hypothetical protein